MMEKSAQATTDSQPAPNSRRGSEANARSRPRASLACLNCRQRKVKCNIPSPGTNLPCTSCQSFGIPCVLNSDGDRRKAGSRAQVTMLQERVRQLESIVNGNEVAADATSTPLLQTSFAIDEEQQEPAEILANLAQNITHRSPVPQTQFPFGHPEYQAHINSSLPIDTSQSAPDLRLTQSFSGLTGQANFEASQTRDAPESSANDPLGFTPAVQGRRTPLSEPSDSRLGVDNDLGEARYYGPTCPLYIQWRDKDDNEAYPNDDPSALYLRLDSETLRSQLFSTFWATQLLSVPIVDQQLFQTGRKSGTRSNYYSVFLECCILGCATRLRTSAGVRALGRRYIELARSEILNEIERPNIATLQGFLLLSDFEATRGRDRLGYLYCGISCRLSFDLGLPQSCLDLVANGKLTPLEASLRRQLFFGLVVYEKLWALYLGRSGAITLATILSVTQQTQAQHWDTSATAKAWADLCTNIGEVTELFDSFPRSDSDFERVVGQVDGKISKVQQTLSPALDYQDNEVLELEANAYGLHVQLCGTRIVLNKLLLNAVLEGSGDVVSLQHNGDTRSNHLRAVMYDNAVRIARLMSSYQQIFGIENIITVMLDNTYIAAAVIISHFLSNQSNRSDNDDAERDVQWLRNLADILLKVQVHYPVAARIRSTLSKFVRDSSLAGMFGSWVEERVNTEKTMVWNLDLPGTQNRLNGNSDPRDESLLAHDPFVGAPSEQNIFQDMDMGNMMSWVFND